MDIRQRFKQLDLTKIFKHNLAIAFILLFLVVFGIGSYIFLWWLPNKQALAFVAAVEPEFKDVQQEMVYYEGAFIDVSNSYADTKQAFYEISVPKEYKESVVDTRQDIIKIKALLKKINKAQQTLASFPTPHQVKPLATDLAEYYSQIKTGMQLLLEHEQLHQQLLEIGSEFDTSLDTINNVLQNGGTRGEMIFYSEQAAVEASRAAQRMEPIIFPVRQETELYAAVYTEHLAFYDAFRYCAQQFSKNTRAADHACSQKMQQLQVGQQKQLIMAPNGINRSPEWQAWIDHSPIKTAFEKAQELETHIKTEFAVKSS